MGGSVKVPAEATPVETASSERSGLLDNHQVNNLTTRGRDIMGLLITLPGVFNDGRGGDSLGTRPGGLLRRARRVQRDERGRHLLASTPSPR